MNTRRAFLALLPLVASADGPEAEIPAGSDTFVLILPGTVDGTTLVAVRTRIKADRALVTVFYRPSSNPRLLLSHESVAPIAGFDAWGATRRDFPLTSERIEFIQVEFLNDVAKRETNRRW